MPGSDTDTALSLRRIVSFVFLGFEAPGTTPRRRKKSATKRAVLRRSLLTATDPAGEVTAELASQKRRRSKESSRAWSICCKRAPTSRLARASTSRSASPRLSCSSPTPFGLCILSKPPIPPRSSRTGTDVSRPYAATGSGSSFRLAMSRNLNASRIRESGESYAFQRVLL